MVPTAQKVAIVTGAASGIGEGLATQIASKNWLVAIVDIQVEAGTKLAKSLGPNAQFWYADVSCYESQSRMFQGVFDKWGRIDAFLANAGTGDRSSVYGFRYKGDTIPPEPDLTCTDVNFKGFIYGTQLAVYFMRKNSVPGGKIIATSSIAAIYPYGAFPEYSGNKAAIIQFARAVAPVLKLKENVYINTILPGVVMTKIIPQSMLDAIPSEYHTPLSTIVAAFEHFLADGNTQTGEAMECSIEKLLLVPVTEFQNGKMSKMPMVFSEPLFEMVHGEPSRLSKTVE